MSNPRIALLCNHKMATLVLQRMQQEGTLCAIATTDKDKEVTNWFREQAKHHQLPYTVFSSNNYQQQLMRWLDEIEPEAVFVMTFPWRIPGTVLSVPPGGFINFHPGLLPEMRGADPVFESIRQRRPTAGFTVHQMDEHFDTGPVLLRQEIPLSPEHTYGMLASQMAWIGEKMCTQIIQELKSNSLLSAVPQQEANAVYWPRVGREALAIKWKEMDAATIVALVKACNPVIKGVAVQLNGWTIGLVEVSEVNLQGDASSILPGTILALDPQNGLLVCCKDGKALKLEVIYTEEGILPGYKLSYFGITSGTAFADSLGF